MQEEFASRVRDVACGAQILLEVIERDAIDEGCADGDLSPLPRLLSATDSGHLMRMCIASLDMLAEEATEHGDWLEKRAKRATG